MRKKIIIVTIILSILLFVYMFTQAGNYLTASDIAKKSDVIVVLGGDNGRAEYGIELLKSGYADYIIFSGYSKTNTITEAELMKRQAVELGVSEEKIIVEDKASNTLTNGIYSQEVIRKCGFQSAIIVTSDYHMRRTRLVFNKLFKGSKVTLTYCTSKSSYNPQKWYEDSFSFHITKEEYIKILGYGLYHRLWFK